MSYYHIMKYKKACLRRVWIRLTTAYLLCAREFRQNNALALQFWCLSNALTLRVRALDASKSQRTCIILSKFTRKSKYAVINISIIKSLRYPVKAIGLLQFYKLYPTLRMSVMSLHILCYAGLECMHCCQFARKNVRGFKNVQLKRWC